MSGTGESAESGPAAPIHDAETEVLGGPLMLERPPGGRYELGGEMARGAMGRIVEAWDRELRRRVALKLMTSRLPGARGRFVREAQIAAQLDHPNVVPVHELGQLPSGELYYAMKLVRGRTLSEVMREASQLRLLHIVEQVAMGVGYAHSKGIVHRDLKPANIMVGHHGEVYVMDWGVAKIVGETDAGAALPLDGLDLAGSPDLTREGAIFGTPGYMSPEQASRRPIDPGSDVFALGVILYEVLVGARLFGDLPTWEILRLTVQRDMEPPSRRAAGRAVPEEIERVAMRALARDRAARFPTATAMGEAIRAFLEGAERQRLADERTVLAREAAAEHARLADRARRARAEVRRAAAAVRPHEPIEVKRRLWAVEREAETADLARDAALARTEELCEQALGFSAGHAGARACLAGLYAELHAQAESARDRRLSAHYERLVRRHDDGAYAGYLEGTARLHVESDPPGARVLAYRYADEDGLLIARDERMLGVTPLDASLPFGSHLLVLGREGFRDVRYPVLLARNEEFSARVRLRTDAAIGEGFVYVPAGRFVFGGDPEAPASRERAVIELPDFAIAKFPVTCGEYAEFLNALPPTVAAKKAPKYPERIAPLWRPDDDGRYRLPCADADGDVYEPRFPVAHVAASDAEAYADRQKARLPSEEEWEKAARGADGRPFPWGHRFDPALCLMLHSRPGRPYYAPTGSYASDESPFGVRDLAGGIRDWTSSAAVEDPDLRVAKGGAFSRRDDGCRAAFREPNRPTQIVHYQGFRLAKSF
ncbi:MAG: bifunctional serine/threonine-protein kinase/formylglycine-generating enzyme family protein [Myxococcota bacterium]